jgi:hypothetical protein
VLLAVTIAGSCGYIPVPGGDGSTSIEPQDPVPPRSMSATPAAAAGSLVEAWGKGDRETADLVSETEALRQLFKREPPDVLPHLINCSHATMVAGGMDCLFTNGTELFAALAVPRSGTAGWIVRSIKFQPDRGSPLLAP